MRDRSSECAKGESGHRASPPQRIAVDSERDEPQRTQHQASLRSRRVAELERELEFTKSKLSCAIHELEIANEDRKSVNAKLAALNGVLWQTLARRRTCLDLEGASCSVEIARLEFAGLTNRQRQVMELVLAGRANKHIAADLGISQRTVESHRARVMKKTGAKSLPALARMALAGASNNTHEDMAQARLRDFRAAMPTVGSFRVYRGSLGDRYSTTVAAGRIDDPQNDGTL
jgi:DNA-binding CsgD family transcriptional regulator